MAETLSCLAGLGGMGRGRFLLGLVVGTVPFAWVFAWTGERLGRVQGEPGSALLVALAIPALAWLGFVVVASRAQEGNDEPS